MSFDRPESPADCVDDIPLKALHRDLIVARIDYLITQRVRAAVMAAIEQAHAAAINALTAPITAAEVAKALEE